MSHEKDTGRMDITVPRVDGNAQDEDDDFETRKEVGSTGKLGNVYRQEDRQSATQERDREAKEQDRASRGLRPSGIMVEGTVNGTEGNKDGPTEMLSGTETYDEKEQEDDRDVTRGADGTAKVGSLVTETNRKRKNAQRKRQNEADNNKGNKRKRTETT